jgi:hypothetical protein
LAIEETMKYNGTMSRLRSSLEWVVSWRDQRQMPWAIKQALCSCLLGARLVIAGACNSLTGAQDLPAGTSDPALFQTEQGAQGMYEGALQLFHEAVASVVRTVGQFTDELAATSPGVNLLDARQLQTFRAIGDYVPLQQVRGQARQARGALTQYAPTSSPVLRGELYAIEGYAELLLADEYCSGIPLSTLDFDGDFTYHAGVTDSQVYTHAALLFDSALALSADSLPIQYLAQVGKARALLNLGQYAQAAALVAAVPTNFHYEFAWRPQELDNENTVSNVEGGRGLPYRIDSDPRIAAESISTNTLTGLARFLPGKYLPSTTMQPYVIASGVEARLIEAEAALRNDNVPLWAETLNDLRANAGAYASPAFGAIPALSADSTTDASDTLRVNVLFHERAYWLFLTGQRQGDLRRLIRQYGRAPDAVYPSQGTTLQGALYGPDITLPITSEMEGANPLFQGCLSRDA